MAQDHNDIYTIVERLRILEEGLNANQKSVNQLSATFKPKTVAVLTSPKDPKNPMAGKLVGGCEESSDDNAINAEMLQDHQIASEGKVEEDTLGKVKQSFADYLKNITDEIKQDSDLKDKKKGDNDLKAKDKQDRDLIAKENREIDPPEFDSDVEEDSELGSALSGVIPAEQPASEPGVSIKEATIDEYDMSQLQKDADARLKADIDKQSAARIAALKNPPKEKSFMQKVGDKQIGMVKGAWKGLTGQLEEAAEPVKTITNECGLWEVHGNEHSGFEIRHGNRRLPTRFKNLNEAELALEMFNARQRKKDEAADYIDEA
jgi:hypothetical protein